MFYSGKYGKSLVSDDFNQMCVDTSVEATIQAYPNPGTISGSMRVVTFKNFKPGTVKVIRSNGKIDMIPGKGTVQIMLYPEEPLPNLERIEE
jgi:hypothetical protein